MRVFRTILGMLLLTVGLPTLLVGAAFWATMQHRDPGGAFTGDLQRVATSGYAVVVDDFDGLLEKDAPFVRFGDTRLRLTVQSGGAPAFLGIAPAADVQRYLADVPQIGVVSIDLGMGALPVTSELRPGTVAPEQLPGRQRFWLKSGTGTLDWNPAELRDTPYSLVVMNPAAQPGVRLESSAAVLPGWLNQVTWALLILGSMLVMIGMIVLGWPSRRREVVYIVEPSQVPDLMQAIGAPLPLSRMGGGRHAGTHRPRTLADTHPRSRPTALTWPPSSSSRPGSTGSAPTGRGSAIPMPAAPVSEPATIGASSLGSVSSGAAAAPVSQGTATVGSPDTAGDPGPAREKAAPGEPIGLITTRPAPGSVSNPTPPAVTTDSLVSRPADRSGRRRTAPQPTDLPIFEASAVGAWVAETAASRARETEARAAAAISASRKEATPPASVPPAPASPTSVPAASVPAASASAASVSAGEPAEQVPDGGTKADAPNAIAAVTARSQPAASAASTTSTASTDPATPGLPGADEQTVSRTADKASSAGAKAAPVAPQAVPAAPAAAARAAASVAAARTAAESAAVAAAAAAAAAKPKAAADSASQGGNRGAAPRAAVTPAKANTPAKAARPAAATPRNALFGGTSTPGWAATGLTRADSGRVGLPRSASKDPAAKSVAGDTAGRSQAPAETTSPAPAASPAASAKPGSPTGDTLPKSAVPGGDKPSTVPVEKVVVEKVAVQAETAEQAVPAEKPGLKSAPGSTRQVPGDPARPAASAPTVPAKGTGKSPATPSAPMQPTGPGRSGEQGHAAHHVAPPLSGSAPADTACPQDVPAGTGSASQAPSRPTGPGSQPANAPAAGDRPAASAAAPAEPVAGASAPVAANTSPTPTRPVPAGPVPVPPTSPTTPRPSVPGPSRPADPDREPVPAGHGPAGRRSASPAAARSETAGQAEQHRGADTRRTPAWPVNPPSVSSAAARDVQPTPKADPHIAEQRIAGPGPAAELPKNGPAAGQRKAGTPAEAKNGPAVEQGKSGSAVEQRKSGSVEAGAKSGPAAGQPKDAGTGTGTGATVTAGGDAETQVTTEETQKADGTKTAKRRAESSLSRLAEYKAEVAELLGGDAAARRRKNTTASGLPAPDPATQEPPIRLTRPPRKSAGRQQPTEE